MLVPRVYTAPIESTTGPAMDERIRRDIALPLYHQIAGIIRSRIEEGTWEDGERIPSEAQLARLFDVSPVTLRQALETLKSEGLLEGRQGSGTYVTYPEPHTEHVAISIPLESVATPMAEYPVRLVSKDSVRPPVPVRRLLGVGADKACVRIRRMRIGPTGPVNFSSSYLPSPLGNALEAADLQRPLLMEALEEHAGQRFTGAFQEFDVSLAGPEESAILEVPLGSALLMVTRAYEYADASIAYVVVNRHPSGRFRYEARLTRKPDLALNSDGKPSRPRWSMDERSPSPPG